MSTAENPTLERLTRAEGCATYNPFFLHISQAKSTTSTSGINWGDYRYNGPELLRCPGWYAFGHFPQLGITEPGILGSDLDNPFRSWVSNDARQGNGVIVRARGKSQVGDGADKAVGLCQQLRRAGPIYAGAKVRISGCYKVTQGDTGGTPIQAGMSVWLKADVQSMTASSDFYSSSSGQVLSGSDTLSVTVGNFIGQNISVGDLLVIGGQSFSSTESPVYQVKTVGVTSLTIHGTFNTTGTGLTFYVARQNDGTASYLGYQGIRVGTSNDVAHIVKVTDSSIINYDYGGEWHNRAFDTTVLPYVDSGGTPSGQAIFFGKYDSDSVGTIQGLNGYPRDAKIWYLDNDFTPSAPSGRVELVTNTTATTGTFIYFEEEVEIPATFANTYEDAWICVLPCAPGDFASIDTDIAVMFAALRVEIIPDASKGIQGRLQRAFSQGVHGGHSDHALVDFDLRHCLRYPIYVPHLYPLKTFPLFGRESADTGDAASSNIDYHFGPGVSGETQAMTEVTGTVISALYAPQDPIPMGSCVVAASLYVHKTDTLSGGVDLSLVQYHHKDVGTPQNFAQLTRFAYVNVADGVSSPTEASFSVYRNRVGHFWTQFSGSTSPDDYANQASAQIVLRANAGVAASGSQFDISNGWILVAVDPRLHMNAYWSNA